MNMIGILSKPTHLAHVQQGKELPTAFTEGAMRLAGVQRCFEDHSKYASKTRVIYSLNYD